MREQISSKEHRALAEFAKPPGTRDWSGIHANSIHALERKGFLGYSRGAKRLTPTGKAALASVPNIFDDLFAQKEAPVPKPAAKKSTKTDDVFRPIEYVETTLHDPVRNHWEEAATTGGVRLYCTQSPRLGADNARWHLQVRAQVKTKAGRGKNFAVGSASMSREDLAWLRDQINVELRRKA